MTDMALPRGLSGLHALRRHRHCRSVRRRFHRAGTAAHRRGAPPSHTPSPRSRPPLPRSSHPCRRGSVSAARPVELLSSSYENDKVVAAASNKWVRETRGLRSSSYGIDAAKAKLVSLSVRGVHGTTRSAATLRAATRRQWRAALSSRAIPPGRDAEPSSLPLLAHADATADPSSAENSHHRCASLRRPPAACATQNAAALKRESAPWRLNLGD